MLSAEECLESLKTMDSGKSPGTDGLPAEFYKVFWEDVNVFNRCLKNIVFQRLSFNLAEKKINNSVTKEKQTSRIFEKLETNYPAKL